MNADTVKASPTSLPHPDRGHGVIVTFRETGRAYWPLSVFVDRDLAVKLRDQIDRALEQGSDRLEGVS